jgi:ABC-type multidrug transport system fused ATPase/permease subunit
MPAICCSGKTTLVNLRCRFYDVDEDTVKVNGINVRTESERRLFLRYIYWQP